MISILKVYGNYGPKSNESLLFSYGFVLPNNPNNTYSVHLGAKSDDFDSKKKMLKREGLGYPFSPLKVSFWCLKLSISFSVYVRACSLFDESPLGPCTISTPRPFPRK